MNDPSSFWKDLVHYQIDLTLLSNQELTLFRQTQTLSRHKTLHKHNYETFQTCN